MYKGSQRLQKSLVLRVYKNRNTVTQISVTSALGYGAVEQTFYITRKHKFFGTIFSIFNTLDNLFGILG